MTTLALIKRCMDDPLIVAVKTLHKDANNTEQEHFRSEAKLLNEFDHENIVKFYGVCFEGEPMYMIFEYMPNGDLLDFLRQRAPSDNISVVIHIRTDSEGLGIPGRKTIHTQRYCCAKRAPRKQE